MFATHRPPAAAAPTPPPAAARRLGGSGSRHLRYVESCGEVTGCDIMQDETGKSKGAGVVLFKTAGAAKKFER
eukprot:gene48463-56300_t